MLCNRLNTVTCVGITCYACFRDLTCTIITCCLRGDVIAEGYEDFRNVLWSKPSFLESTSSELLLLLTRNKIYLTNRYFLILWRERDKKHTHVYDNGVVLKMYLFCLRFFFNVNRKLGLFVGKNGNAEVFLPQRVSVLRGRTSYCACASHFRPYPSVSLYFRCSARIAMEATMATAPAPAAPSSATTNEGILIGDKVYSEVFLTIDNSLIPEEKLSPTPSMLDGLDLHTETDLRILGCELIQAAGILLRLPQVY